MRRLYSQSSKLQPILKGRRSFDTHLVASAAPFNQESDQQNYSAPAQGGQQQAGPPQQQYGYPNQAYAQPQQPSYSQPAYPQQQGYPPQQMPAPAYNPYLDQAYAPEGEATYAGQEQQAAQSAAQGQMLGGYESGQVEQPAIVTWTRQHMNTVRVIGTVGQQPDIRYTQTGKAVANVRLAVKTPGNRENRDTVWMDIELWEKQAQQIERYVQKGMQLAVGGFFKQDTWINPETQQENSRMRLKADYFQLVEPYNPLQQSRGSFLPPAGHGVPGSYAGYEAASPFQQPYSQRGPQQPSSRASRPTQSDLGMYNLWRESPGVNFIQAAEQLSRQPESVLDNLTHAVSSTMVQVTEEDALRLASQLEIGPPDSPFLDIKTINKAIDDTFAEESAKNPSATLGGIRLKPVLERLQADSAPRPNGLPSVKDIIEARHQAFQKIGVSLSYGQLRFAKAMKVRGVDLSVSALPEDIRASYQQFNGKPSQQQQLYSPQQIAQQSVPQPL